MSLYVVAVPIGHPDDITLRAIKILKEVDFVICEEAKVGRRFLSQLDIKKEIYLLNEHNEESDSSDIVQMLKKGESAALISDCGTPLFADPGTTLVRLCQQANITVSPIPGASSLTASLSVAGLNINTFFYAGFLPRSTEERCSELAFLSKMRHPVVIYETPYRLAALLKDLEKEMGAERHIVICMSLTQPDEKIMTGPVAHLRKALGEKPPKKEFVLLIEPVVKALFKKSKKHVKTRKRK